MSSIEQQLEIEDEMIDGGVQRYVTTTAQQEQSGQIAQTSYGVAFIKSQLDAIAAAINERIDKAVSGQALRAGKVWAAMCHLSPHVLAFITLRDMLDAYATQSSFTDIITGVGRKVEDEIRFQQFKTERELHFNAVMRRLKERGTSNYNYSRNVLTHNITHNADGTKRTDAEMLDWAIGLRTQVGAALVDSVLLASPHFVRREGRKNGKTMYWLDISDEMRQWIMDHKEHMGLLFPVWMPTVIPPRDWSSVDDGGFYSARAVKACNMLIVKPRADHRAQRKAAKRADLSRVREGINHLQKTAWRVNTRVLEVAQEVWRTNLGTGMPPSQPIPVPKFPFHEAWKKDEASEEERLEFDAWKHEATAAYTAERERISKCMLVSRIMAMAKKFSAFEDIYFVWRCDFRGRMYAVSTGLSPQGSDISKAMLQFKEGKQLGKEGAYWFKVHGANCYGIDKLSYDERVSWVHEHEEAIAAVAEDPVGARDFWGAADKPWQFLAWCFEYMGYKGAGEEYVSHLAVGLDGTCNGLQNFSAMLRDHVGGAATNLVPGDRPADIYAEVARVTAGKLRDLGTPLALKWVDFGITRSMVKRPVMTLPYGSTRKSCRDYLFEYYLEQRSKATVVFDANEVREGIEMLATIVWASIGEVVIAARAAMGWLQQVASVLSKHGHPVEFTAPSGFVVHQAIKKQNMIRVETILCGSTFVSLGEPGDKMDAVRQRNGISPNFVHSCDASHLIATILKCKQEGITSISAIHDDYGVHAADTTKLHRFIREAFVEQYSRDILREFYDEQCSKYPELSFPEPPPMGALDIRAVLNSAYFFG